MNDKVDLSRINNTLGKFAYYLETHDSICVSVSGGSDSDIIVHIIATYFRQHLDKIHFVFANTGLESQATLDHLDYLESKYQIKIERVKGMLIPTAVKKYGVPLVSKNASEFLSRLQSHNFQFEDEPFEKLYSIYTKCKAALRWWCNKWGEKSRFNIKWNAGLKEKLIQKKPKFKVSCMCCTESKKNPLTNYEKKIHADLIITGERKSEGGVRAGRHSSCFESKKGVDHFMPLFFWNNETKVYYKEQEKIVYSDCYEVWGMKRTGCVGCPFGQHIDEELELIGEYEPKLYKACWNVFGDAYRFIELEERQ